MSFPYELDHDENPVVIRMHSFNYGSNRVDRTAVFVTPSISENYPSAIYTWHPSVTLQIETEFWYRYDTYEPAYLTDFRASWDVEPPADLEVYEIGFVPTLDGLPMPITRENIPETINIQTIQNYAGGAFELGIYIDGVFKVLAAAQLDGYNNWNEFFAIEVEDPFDLTPKLYMRIVDVGHTDDMGTVGVYREPDMGGRTTGYKAPFRFDEGTANMNPTVWGNYATFISLYGEPVTPEITYFEAPFVPLIAGVQSPINPKSPPSSITIASGGSECGGFIQIGVYIDGIFTVMGETQELSYMNEEEHITALVPVAGTPDGDGDTYIRFTGYDSSAEDYQLPYIAAFLESTGSRDDPSTLYLTDYDINTWELEYYLPEQYASGVYLWTFDHRVQGGEPTFKVTLYTDGVKDDMDVMNPPPFIRAFSSYHSAGGKLQVGTYQDNGEFFVMGEQDLPTSDDVELHLYDIPLIAPQPPAVPVFWTGFLRTTEYAKGIGQ